MGRNSGEIVGYRKLACPAVANRNLHNSSNLMPVFRSIDPQRPISRLGISIRYRGEIFTELTITHSEDQGLQFQKGLFNANIGNASHYG